MADISSIAGYFIKLMNRCEKSFLTYNQSQYIKPVTMKIIPITDKVKVIMGRFHNTDFCVDTPIAYLSIFTDTLAYSNSIFFPATV